MKDQINIYHLRNGFLRMQVCNFGARVMCLYMPDKQGQEKDIVLGYKSVEEYLDNKGERFLGSVIGRYGNRIAEGRFEIDGQTYQFAQNNNGQCLHGGVKSLDSVVWEVTAHDDHSIDFRYLSPDGEEGFPGNLDIRMRYELTAENAFHVSYRATTDKKTHVNLTHHSFFNLKGEGCGDINDHIMQINADGFLPVNEVLIPLGNVADVTGTPMDFRTPTSIGSRLELPDEQLKMGNGYDHCWVLNRKTNDQLEFAARVTEPKSGRVMEVWTDQPGMQFYGGNFFDGKTKSKSGEGFYEKRGSLALETQHFPDSPNQTNFPSTLLCPGETYRHECVYKFDVLK